MALMPRFAVFLFCAQALICTGQPAGGKCSIAEEQVLLQSTLRSQALRAEANPTPNSSDGNAKCCYHGAGIGAPSNCPPCTCAEPKIWTVWNGCPLHCGATCETLPEPAPPAAAGQPCCFKGVGTCPTVSCGECSCDAGEAWLWPFSGLDVSCGASCPAPVPSGRQNPGAGNATGPRPGANSFDLLGEWTMFTDLFQCIHSLPSQYQLDGLFNMAHTCWHEQEKCLPSVATTYITPALDSVKEFLDAHVVNGLSTHWLQKANASNWVSQLSKQALNMTSELLAMPGFEPAGCIFEAVGVPSWQAFSDTFIDSSHRFITGIIDTVNGWIERVWEKILNSELAGALFFNLEALSDDGSWLQRLIKAGELAAANQCQIMMASSSSALASYTGALQSGKLPDSQALIRTLMANDVASLAATVGGALVLFIEYWVGELVDLAVTPMFRRIANLIQSLITTASNGILSICGLIPEWGTALCSLILNSLATAAGWFSQDSADQAVTVVKGWISDFGYSISKKVQADITANVTNITLEAVDVLNSDRHVLAPLLKVFNPWIAYLMSTSREHLSSCQNMQHQLRLLVTATQSLAEKQQPIDSEQESPANDGNHKEKRRRAKNKKK